MKYLVIISLFVSLLVIGQENYKYRQGNLSTYLYLNNICCNPVVQLKRISDSIIPIQVDTITPIESKWRDYQLDDVWGTSLWKDSYWESSKAFAYTNTLPTVNDSIIEFTLFPDTSYHPRFTKFNLKSWSQVLSNVNARMYIVGKNIHLHIYENNGQFYVGSSSSFSPIPFSIVEQSFDTITGHVFLRLNQKFRYQTGLTSWVYTNLNYRVYYNFKQYRPSIKIVPLINIRSGYYCLMAKYNGRIDKQMIYLVPQTNFLIKPE